MSTAIHRLLEEMWLQALKFLLIFTRTHASTSVFTERPAGILISFSPLPQHYNFRLRSTPLAEGEELVDDASRFAQELLGAELQLSVALVNRRIHLPEVLDGGRVQSVECRKPSNKILKLFWKTERKTCEMRADLSFCSPTQGKTTLSLPSNYIWLI